MRESSVVLMNGQLYREAPCNESDDELEGMSGEMDIDRDVSGDEHGECMKKLILESVLNLMNVW